MTTLQQVKQELLALKPGGSARFTNANLVEIKILEVDALDTGAKADWLRKQLPFPCDVNWSLMTGDCVFSRPSIQDTTER